ncbi:MAG: PilT/PilU family type 4a pilus ATPase [Phycisphaerae bacterium]|nr:PilT/PilU family type 4a pilus ATPase [Phycisphaerae bacterium]MDW8263435.1 PilT/PilU family type 4a pilus ATPase [Phycisphaerales bacterium]
MDLQQLLRFGVENNASDIHIQAGLPPRVRIGGILRAVTLPPLSDEVVRRFIASLAPPRFHDDLDRHLYNGIDFSYSAEGIARFRCSAYQQLGRAGIALRIVRSRIPTISELNLPEVVSEIALARRGLTLVTGTTGSGKSTTLAAMIDLINQNFPVKIICIEDPVEYVHVPKQALISQLEVGSDTPDFDQALRQALRQDPDVVLVGELRDVDTLKTALRAADTGHQVFSTVHSASAPQTIERIIAMFPPAEHKLLLTQLAANLEAIISQRLLLCRDNLRRPAVEILRGGPIPTKYILEGRAMELGDYLKTAGNGQQTFDQDLLSMFKRELISYNEAMRNASSPEALQMMLRGISGSPGARAG